MTEQRTCAICGNDIPAKRAATYRQAVLCGEDSCAVKHSKLRNLVKQKRWRDKRIAADPEFRFRALRQCRKRYIARRLAAGKIVGATFALGDRSPPERHQRPGTRLGRARGAPRPWKVRLGAFATAAHEIEQKQQGPPPAKERPLIQYKGWYPCEIFYHVSQEATRSRRPLRSVPSQRRRHKESEVGHSCPMAVYGGGLQIHIHTSRERRTARFHSGQVWHVGSGR